MDWKRWIKRIGKRHLSIHLNISYESIRCWSHGTRVPNGENFIKLVEYAQRTLSEKDFMDVFGSLLKDTTGMDILSFLKRAA